jgi:hypothetical protein
MRGKILWRNTSCCWCENEWTWCCLLYEYKCYKIWSEITLIAQHCYLVSQRLFCCQQRKKGCWKVLSPTKIGIYSTYSTRSFIHFLAPCSNFCKPLKKIQKIVRPNSSPRQQWPSCRTKNGELPVVVFSVQGIGGSPRGHIRRIWRVIKTLEAQVGQFLLGCKCPVSQCIVVQEQTTLGEFPVEFSFKISIKCTSRDE